MKGLITAAMQKLFIVSGLLYQPQCFIRFSEKSRIGICEKLQLSPFHRMAYFKE